MSVVPRFHRYYDGAVPPELCKRVVEAFEKDVEGQAPGRLLDRQVRDSIKKCTDIPLGLRIRESDELRDLWKPIDDALYACVAASWQRFRRDVPSVQHITDKCLLQDTGYQLQRYEPHVGYFGPHIDSGSVDSAFRIAAAVIYFNTVEEGGGTNFPEWNETVDAVEGRILWFPAGWTHIHQGLIPLSGRKYIASTFMCYKGYASLDSANGACYRHIMDQNRTAALRKEAPDEEVA